MGQAKEKLRIFENVMARVGLAGDFLGEYFKALAGVNGLQTYNELNPPMAPLQAPQAPMSGQPMMDTAMGEMPANVPQNTPTGMV